jgi:hypothetical protein
MLAKQNHIIKLQSEEEVNVILERIGEKCYISLNSINIFFDSPKDARQFVKILSDSPWIFSDGNKFNRQ